jgi:hypothetical protein
LFCPLQFRSSHQGLGAILLLQSSFQCLLTRNDPIEKNQIRLLELHAASLDKADLQGTIHIQNVTEKPELGYDHDTPPPPVTPAAVNSTTAATSIPYTALSHHWGPRGGKSIIRIIKNDLSYEITIRANLEPALRTMRSKITAGDAASRFYWIDAICIDQSDPNDKDKQIPMMAQIYNGAKRVCVWLGSEFPESKVAIGFIQKLNDLDGLTKLLTEENTFAEWDAFAQLVRQPWFSRRWIVQEIAVARDAIMSFGESAVDWEDFANAMSLFASLKEDIRKLFQSRRELHFNPDHLGDIMESGANKLVQAKSAIFRTKHNKQISEHLLSLEGLISILTVFDVEDPMDLIYSILWLSKDARPGPSRRNAAKNHPNAVPTPAGTPHGSREGSLDPESSEYNALVRFVPNGLDTPRDDCLDVDDDETDHDQHKPMGPNLAVPGSDARTVREIEREHSPTRAPIAINHKQPVFDLCREVLQFIVKKSNRLDMMCFPWAPEPRLEDHSLKYRVDETAAAAAEPFVPEPKHPSWLCCRKNSTFGRNPKGQYRRKLADPLVGTPGIGQRTYLACGKTRAYGKTGADVVEFSGRKMTVSGLFFDQIDQIELPAQAGNIPPAWTIMAMWEDTKTYPPDRFWRTLVADSDLYGKDPPTHYKLACQWAFSQRAEGDYVYPSELLTHMECPKIAADFLRRVQAVAWGRRLFMIKGIKDGGVISDGYLGLAPEAAQKGDLVCILKGCSAPVVLRKVVGKKRRATQHNQERGRASRQRSNNPSDGPDSPQSVMSVPTIRVTGGGEKESDDREEDHDERLDALDVDIEYQFIGDCYVHGIMDGEAFQYMDERGRVEKRFVLV